MPGKHPTTGKPLGTLKKGNTTNTGAKPEALRALFRDSINVAQIKRIAANQECIDCSRREWVKKDGQWVQEISPAKRRPKVGELLAANEFLAKYGIGTKQEVTIEETPSEAYLNLSALTDEELKLFEQLAAKAAPQPAVH